MRHFRMRHLIGALALAILVLYVLGATGVLQVSRELMLLPFLALGPLGIVGVIELGRLLADQGGSIASRAGTVFGIVAFSIWEVVVLVQRGTAGLWRDFVAPDLAQALDGGAETVRLLYRGVSAVQATMDVGFDIFYCLCILLFSALMLSDEIFGRWVGALGLISGSGLLVLNLWTFPRPPAEAGLVDVGPLTAVWWILVVVLWARHETSLEVEAD